LIERDSCACPLDPQFGLNARCQSLA
jgi:hypothetical protein